MSSILPRSASATMIAAHRRAAVLGSLCRVPWQFGRDVQPVHRKLEQDFSSRHDRKLSNMVIEGRWAMESLGGLDEEADYTG
jgi:hypothetical protein